MIENFVPKKLLNYWKRKEELQYEYHCFSGKTNS